MAVGGCKPLVGTCKSLVGACEMPVGGCKSLVGACKPVVGACETLVGGCKSLVGTCELMVGRCKSTVAGCNSFVGRCQPIKSPCKTIGALTICPILTIPAIGAGRRTIHGGLPPGAFDDGKGWPESTAGQVRFAPPARRKRPLAGQLGSPGAKSRT